MPLSLAAAVIFVYNRMTMDSELVVIRSSGYTPLALARPALLLAILVTMFLWVMTLWAGPKSLSSMQQLRQVIKAQVSSLLFREGVFNQLGQGLTVYIRERASDGELHGLMIHDTRKVGAPPSTILAKRGLIVGDEDGQEVLVYDGSRQEFDSESGTMRRLNFQRYTIDLPDSAPVRQRWKEPEERTITELLRPNLNSPRDVDNLSKFRIEVHKRILGPILAVTFAFVACAALLVGPVERRGQGRRIAGIILTVFIVQGLFITGFNISRHNQWGLAIMYLCVFVPLGISAFILSGFSENARRRFFFEGAKGPAS